MLFVLFCEVVDVLVKSIHDIFRNGVGFVVAVVDAVAGGVVVVFHGVFPFDFVRCL